jgi:glycosyltransferase involved in cell wall biosynthesis/SAM-dependent methyltransferase
MDKMSSQNGMIDDQQRNELIGSGLFDSAWYADQNKDVGHLGMDPLDHYLWLGRRLMRSPGPAFDAKKYLQLNTDVARTGYDPVLHYIRYGKKEGREAPNVRHSVEPRPGPGASETTPQRTDGLVALRPGKPVVLLCSHVAGERLFGSERSLLDMLDGLDALGLNVIVTVPGKGNSEYFEALRHKSHAVYTFKYGWWRKGLPVDESVVAAFARIVADEGVGVVHVNTIVLREPLLAARRVGVRSVVHVRELIQHDSALLEMIGEPEDQIIESVWQSADLVIANSKATQWGFVRRGKLPSLVYNTADLDTLAELDRPRHGPGLRVGLISSNIPKKGIWDLVEVARQLSDRHPDLRFRLIGPETSHTEEIAAGIEAGEIPKSLEIAGYRGTPAEAVQELDVVLSISNFHESFGRTVLEAMAAGRPVIVYDCGAPPEIVEDDTSGFVVPVGDTNAVANAVSRLARDARLFERIARSAEARATAMFGRDAYVRQMRTAYDEILTEDAPEPERIVLKARRDQTPTPREQLKIAYFSWHFPVPSETFVLNELRLLKAAGFDVQVFCKQSPYPDFKPDFDISWEQVRDPDHLAARLLETGRTIVHSHFCFPTVTNMVWPACEKANVEFTFIPHAQDIFRFRNDVSNRIGEVSQSKLCKKVFVPSRFHREYLAKRGVPVEKMMINPNGCDHRLYADGVVPERVKRPFRRITAIHRFTEKKGLVHLIRAGKLLAEDSVQIDLYGYGDLEDEFRHLVAEEGVTNVAFCGPVKSREEMLEVFRQSDLFACPSVRAADGDMDGIPTVLMEAMSAGLPVLTTRQSGIPDLVEDGITGMVAEARPEALAERIRAFYRLPDVAVSAMIETASDRIRDDYNSELLVEWLLRVWAGETIDLMIVAWNNLEQTSEVIRRLYKYTSLPFHLIVCDNGSDPDALAHHLDVYAKHDNFTLILNRKNSFVGPGTNICMDAGQSDYALYVCGKEGMTTNYGWEKPFVRYLDANPDVGQAGTLCYSPSYLYGRDYPKAQALFDKFRNPEFAQNNPDRMFSHVQGGFFAIRRKMYDEIGGFSEAVPHNSTDVEFSYYVESMGWKLGEVPGLMSLFNKTRPGLFHRIDEHHAALHPPMLRDLPALERIAKRQVNHCNACGQQSPEFFDPDGDAICPKCGATRRGRSIHRVLAESLLLYRRLPALGVNVPESIIEFWRTQFQGQIQDLGTFIRTLSDNDRTDFSDHRLDLVLLNGVLVEDQAKDRIGRASILAEASRILKPGGTLLVAGVENTDEATRRLGMAGFELTHAKRYSSSVSRYDWYPVLVCRKSGA